MSEKGLGEKEKKRYLFLKYISLSISEDESLLIYLTVIPIFFLSKLPIYPLPSSFHQWSMISVIFLLDLSDVLFEP